MLKLEVQPEMPDWCLVTSFLRFDMLFYLILFHYDIIHVVQYDESNKRNTVTVLYKRCNSCRSLFFTERVVNIWKKLPVSITDFRTLSSFKKSFLRIGLTGLLADAWLLDCFIVQFNCVCDSLPIFCQLLEQIRAAFMYLPVLHLCCLSYLLMTK